jgi:hypothetical protein
MFQAGKIWDGARPDRRAARQFLLQEKVAPSHVASYFVVADFKLKGSTGSITSRRAANTSRIRRPATSSERFSQLRFRS